MSGSSAAVAKTRSLRFGSGGPTRVGFLLAVGLLAALTLASSSAFAALTHSTVEKTFPIGAECTNGAGQVAVDETDGLVYVVCLRAGNRPTIKRFHLNGAAAPFSATAEHISENSIVGNPKSPENGWEIRQFLAYPVAIAVDNSSANPGYLYVAGGCAGCGLKSFQTVEVFAPSGAHLHEFPTGFSEGTAADVDVGLDGFVYVANLGSEGGKIRKYEPVNFNEVRRLFPAKINDFVRVDSSGAVWTGMWTLNEFGSQGPTEVVKFEADQFGTNFDTRSSEAGLFPAATFSPFVSATGQLPGVKNPVAIEVDPTNDDLYVKTLNTITPYTAGNAEELVHQSGPAFGGGTLSGGSAGLAVAKDGRVFAPSGGDIVIFDAGEIVPDVRTPTPQIDQVGHTAATLTAHIDRAGGPPITDCMIEYGFTISYGFEAPCSPDPAEAPPASNFTDPTTEVSATPTGLSTGETYHYRFRAENENGANFGGDRTVVPAFVIKLHTEGATGIDTNRATLHGSFDPDGLDTSYYFEYGADTDYGQATPVTPSTSTPGKVDVTSLVESLPSGRTFHYRLVATNENGTTKGADQTFRSASSPDVAGARATEVRAGSAVLNARIDPVGYDTSYRFEYGLTPEYGSSVPVPDQSIGSANNFVAVSQQIEGLVPGRTYHFRVVAENQWGSSASDDTTFDFAPPACPNAHVRQQTGSSYLPDCRAYELVSPEIAGPVVFFPSAMLPEHQFTEFAGLHLWPVNRGMASGPSRFSYYGSLGSIAGLNAPNSTIDMYMATRTSGGWDTSIPGLQGNEALYVAEKQCSDALHRCIDHKAPDGATVVGESAPYLFTSEGKPLGQLPTNVDVVPGGKNFVGDQRPSYDLSHFVFSSRTATFTPDGLADSAAYPGSAYDNDIVEKTVALISRLPNGEAIPNDTGETQHIEFPGISTDGSHILMSVKANDGPSHLYMRVDDSVSYDVSKGAGVTFVGMTRSGSTVYFAATQQLTPEDTDTGADLYMWSEATDALTRVSQGNGNGDTDGCAATWVEKCGVAPLTTEMENPFGKSSVPGLDDKIAESSGDVYFYSPESLDPDRPALANQRNLYIYRDGTVKFVASFDPGTQVNRMQISPDGKHAGMLTAARLTGYDNRGFKEMYMFNAETGAMTCASCRPDGLAPTSSVEASQGGPFMSDDGRVFFTTKDPLVPADANGSILDVYEFVGGRPQLISSGAGSRDRTAGGVFFPEVRIGLESVSADGVDVYFSTYDTLVPQDENGPFLKFYDARTGGGFDLAYQIAPCEAADECHGAEEPAPPPPAITTGGYLGDTGNARPRAKRKKKAKRRRKRARNGRHRNRKRSGKRKRGSSKRQQRVHARHRRG